MSELRIDGADNVDDVISPVHASDQDTLISSTGSGNDHVTPWAAAYLVHLGEGDDQFDGYRNGGTVWGEAGRDIMFTGPHSGTHVMYGGSEHDWISATSYSSSTGTLLAHGDEGHDLFADSGVRGTETVSWNGGDGFDIVFFTGSGALALKLDGQGTGGTALNRSFSSVEGVGGTQSDDSIIGSIADNLIVGGGGNDHLTGAGGNDLLIGDARYDEFYEAYTGTLISSAFTPEAPLDPLNSNALGGWAFDSGGLVDTLLGGAGSDVLMGGDGGDSLNGGDGSDWVSYVSAREGVSLRLARGGTQGQAAGDVFRSVENAQGSNFADLLIGSAQANELRGLNGADQLKGLAGSDTLLGGGDSDTLVGADGADVLTGGADADVFVISGPDATLFADHITDMEIGIDTIHLSRHVIRNIGPAGAELDSARFTIGSEATTRAQRILYDETNGDLLFDADGNGAGSAVLIAQLSAGLALDVSDFQIIA
ncbi:hypothetical protein SAMN04488103_10226 [Gemmobacter aquatilis]|uniref:Hemolysin-type calcium-binding repeat-containing protein n=1 Tax=Gemmobacter aquatilis TaxID=933059 RepID=A0A1H8B293_9RHOB|nr:calcium-binding protein [Gemmobacter aquatilis]SEM76873.1 hypothetical protein SAMN04488103_10226 [Gemmobacter aquatilis]